MRIKFQATAIVLNGRYTALHPGQTPVRSMPNEGL